MDTTYTDLGYEIVDVTTWRSSSDTEYDKKWKLCTEDRKNHYYRKLK